MTRTSRATAVAAVLTTLVLALSACGDDEPEGGDDPTTAASAAPTPSGSESATSTESTKTTEPTPTEETSPSVAPAAGLTLEEETSAVNVPEGWTATEPIVDWASGAAGPARYDSIQLTDRPSLAGDATLEEQAEVAFDNLPKGADGERLPDVELGGTTFYVIRYTEKGRPPVNWDIAAVRNGHTIALDISYEESTLAADPMLVESVLASFRFLD